MSATLNKLTIVGTATLALLVLASGASAATSLGFPKGRPYYGGSSQQSGARAFRSYSPAYSTETRQSFSYEPAEAATSAKDGCPQRAAVPQATKKDEATQGVATDPQVTRRSYSYEPAVEPAQRVRSFNRNVAPKRDAWSVPKADPRRYSR